jgi:dolichyl-phosphate beta-glucosyltransferase
MMTQTETSRAVLLVPCYNEAERLPGLMFAKFLAAHPNIVIVFVNDGSADATDQVLLNVQKQAGSRQVQILSLERNCGKAEAIRRGMLWVLSEDFQQHYRSDLIGYVDADLATPLSEMQRLIEIASRRPEIMAVVGSRMSLQGHQVTRTLTRQCLGKMFALAASLTMGIGLRDTQCGAKLFRKGSYLQEVFSQPFLDRWFFDIEILARMQSMHVSQIYECPLEQWRDVANSRLRTHDFALAPWKLCRLAMAYRIAPIMSRWLGQSRPRRSPVTSRPSSSVLPFSQAVKPIQEDSEIQRRSA